MTMLTLKPAEGRTVPQEDGEPWPAGGLAVEPTAYIRRRLTDGDLIAAEPRVDARAAERPAKTGKES